MRRTRAALRDLASGVLDIPSELLSCIFRTVGLKSALSSLPPNSKLHQAWQAAVGYVDIDASTLRTVDIKIISKLVNLEVLRFHGPTSEGAVPVWRVAALVAPELSRLTRLEVVGISGAFGVLKAITYAHGLSSRLKDLGIGDATHKLCPDDLWALVDLKALDSLVMSYQQLDGSPEDLSCISSQLTALESLQLEAEDASSTPAALLAAFPGQLTGLTYLCIDASVREGAALGEQQLVSAISALTNLQQLHSNFALHNAAAQQQALGQLKQLTCLELSGPEDFPQLTMLSALPDLKVLTASMYSVADPFQHPALEELTAGRIEVSEQWRGKTAEECSISKLTFSNWSDNSDAIDDDALQNMPLLPQLADFSCSAAPSDGRYLQLAALLRRQASSLRYINLHLAEHFLEGLPRELPVCKKLFLHHEALSKATLQLLSMSSLPCVSFCSLGLVFMGDLDVEADLGWLRALPQLQKVKLEMAPGDASQQVRAEVQGMLGSQGVEVVLEDAYTEQ